MSFDLTLGHQAILASLRAAFASDTVHHALLFAGPEGVGKHRVAMAFIRLVSCSGPAPVDADGGRLDGCGTCRSCRHLDAMEADPEAPTPPDLVRLSPEGTSRVIKIEPVRELLRVVPFPPIEAPYRFVLIDPAETLTTEAANALLKTLEEPPSRTRFILVTAHADALLTTIRSRCQRVPFGRLSDEDVTRGLVRDAGLAPAEARRIAPLADGSLGTARRLLDDPVMARRDELVAALVQIPPGAATPALELAGVFLEHKEALSTVFEILRRVYRDALILREGAVGTLGLSHPELVEEWIAPLATRYGTQALLHRLALIDETQRGIERRNLNPRLSMERLVAALSAPAGREGAVPGVL